MAVATFLVGVAVGAWAASCCSVLVQWERAELAERERNGWRFRSERAMARRAARERGPYGKAGRAS